MKKKIAVFILSALLLFSPSLPVSAQEGQPPIGVCPRGFEPHELDDHMGDHHHHIGLLASLNADNTICVKHLDNGLHVHVDNVVRP